MAGSLKYIKYDSDDGGEWALFRDESNVESVVATDADIDIAVADVATRKYQLPRNLNPRFATYRSTSTVRTRKVVIPTVAIYNDLAAGANLLAVRTFSDLGTGEIFQLQSLSPERIRPVVIDADTAINDGDAS